MAVDDLWYVAYGSNLSAARFHRYLDECADPTGPRDARPGVIPHRLFFAHESSTWTGGTAFVDPAPTDARTRTVSWLITGEQFLHVLARENGRASLPATMADLPTAVGRTTALLPSRYGLVIALESPDDRPAYTFTTGEDPLPAATRPAPDYADTIVTGLVERHGLTDGEARSYLAAHGGSVVEGGAVPDPGEELPQRLERDTVVEQDAHVTAESEIAGDERVERGPGA